MKVAGQWRRTIEVDRDGRQVIILDQAKLPYAIEWLTLTSVADVAPGRFATCTFAVRR